LRFKIKNLINFTYQELVSVYSPINGEIKIYRVFGEPRMAIGGLLQSGGIISTIWQKAAERIARQRLVVKNILILGLGCGTVAKVFSQKFPKAKMLGVEIDPLVIKLGKSYFDLGKIPKLKIECEDVLKTVDKLIPILNDKNFKKTQPLALKHFELIVVDVYLGEKIPEKTESLNFLRKLKNLLKPAGLVVFNRLFWDEHRQKTQNFVKRVEKIFPFVDLVRTPANLLVFTATKFQ